jgi:5'-3' exonuclease
MINKIKQMEIDSKSNLKEKQQNLIDSNVFDFKILNDKYLDWKEEIRNPKLDETRLKEIIKESINLLKKNEKKSFEFKNKILLVLKGNVEKVDLNDLTSSGLISKKEQISRITNKDLKENLLRK